jgi:hypothetical protein
MLSSQTHAPRTAPQYQHMLMISTGIPTIQIEDFNATIYAEEAFFLHLQNFDTTEDEKVGSTLQSWTI